MHYLVKPYTEDELSSLTDEILSRIPTPEKTLPLKVNGSEFQVPFKTIVHADHFSHMIHIHTTAKKELVIRQSFSAFLSATGERSLIWNMQLILMERCFYWMTEARLLSVEN